MTPAPPRPGERRAFVLPVVLMLVLVSTLMIAAAFDRHDSQRRIVERQLVEYRRHHEMFGVRAITRQWVDSNMERLAELAMRSARDRARERNRGADFDYGFVLPSGAEIRIWVADGQGSAHTDPSTLPDNARMAYEAMLARLPVGKPGLRRKVGQPLISINGAPREVIAAMVDDEGERLADRVISERERDPLDLETFQRLLRSRGVDDLQMQAILGMVAYTPTLFRLDIQVTDDHGERYFNMLLEPAARASQLVARMTVHEWFEVPPPADDEESGQGERGARRDRNRQPANRR